MSSTGLAPLVLLLTAPVALQSRQPAGESAPTVDMERLLAEMVDLAELARRPEPFYRTACASSYSRRSHAGGEAWFDNYDVGQYVRTDDVGDHVEHVLADLQGPGAVVRLWSANPGTDNTVRFYFDGEETPRLALPFSGLFTGATAPFEPVFSYVSGTGGNLYYPLPYAESLRITVEDVPGAERPLRLYFEIAYRTYDDGTQVDTFDPARATSWEATQDRVGQELSVWSPPPSTEGVHTDIAGRLLAPGTHAELVRLSGPQVVRRFSARLHPDDATPLDAEQMLVAWRSFVLEIDFDGQPCVRAPLGDFFGSGPGVNPHRSLLFAVSPEEMECRLLMPFQDSMVVRVSNQGRIPAFVELALLAAPRPFDERDQLLHAQWGTLTRDSWPPFDTTVLETTGSGKVVGSVYEIANPVLIWWGEGDQKVFVDGEDFPSTFGTGTEDDYGFAYGYNQPFARPYHGQPRVDGPASGGHISLYRWYVLDALPFRSSIRFDQEMWHWMPCRPTWSHVVYWYAAPGSPGPRPVDPSTLGPVDLGVRENMLDPIEGELCSFAATAGTARAERLANCSRAEHLVWRDASPGDRLQVRFHVPAGRYSVELNLCMGPDHGRFRFRVNGVEAAEPVDCFAPGLFWCHPRLGTFDLAGSENVLEVERLEPAEPDRDGALLGLDYLFLVRQ